MVRLGLKALKPQSTLDLDALTGLAGRIGIGVALLLRGTDWWIVSSVVNGTPGRKKKGRALFRVEMRPSIFFGGFMSLARNSFCVGAIYNEPALVSGRLEAEYTSKGSVSNQQNRNLLFSRCRCDI